MNKLQEKIFVSIGAASMCWDEIPKGVFDSTKAKKIAEDLCRDVEHLIKALKFYSDHDNYEDSWVGMEETAKEALKEIGIE